VNRVAEPLNGDAWLPTVLRVKAVSSTWQDAGACRNGPAEDFYPPMHGERKHERLARERRAKSVCAGCPVRVQCLEHAVALDERYGIWGGLNQDERRLLQASA
jgi:WhiB family redox-sensing transcriptional regulator